MTSKASSGWYPDPQDPQLVRFWDGYAWTSQTRRRDDAPPMDVRDPWSAASQARLGATNPTGFSSTSGLSPAEASVARSGVPAWTWLVIGLVLVALVAGMIWAVGLATGRTSSSPAETSEIEAPAEPVVPVDGSEGTDGGTANGEPVEWDTLNGYARLTVPGHWYEDSATVIAADPTLSAELAGTWNVDGRVAAKTDDFLYAWEFYGEDLSDVLTIEELAAEYYDYWGENVERSAETTEVLTTANGYEAWRQSLTLRADGREYRGLQYVVRNGGAELALVMFRYGNLDGYEDELSEVVDSIEFLIE